MKVVGIAVMKSSVRRAGNVRNKVDLVSSLHVSSFFQAKSLTTEVSVTKTSTFSFRVGRREGSLPLVLRKSLAWMRMWVGGGVWDEDMLKVITASSDA